MSTVCLDDASREPLVLRADEANIATLTLNRPQQYNALSEALLTELQMQLDQLIDDESIQVVVLRGAGKGFCAGHDLREMRHRPEQAYYQQLFRQCGKMMRSLLALPQPVIASVQGIATAAGCQLVGVCDLAVASSTARFAVSGVNLGLFCSTPAVALSRNISRKRALEMLFTGEFISAEQAQEWGLVNRVAAPDMLHETVQAFAQQIAAKPRAALLTGKQMFQHQLEQSFSEALDYAADVMACNMMQAETEQGIDRFLHR